MSWRAWFRDRLVEADQALEQIPSGARIFLGTAAAEPYVLAERLRQVPAGLADAEVVQLWPIRTADILADLPDDRLRMNIFGTGPQSVEAIERGLVDYTPIQLSRLGGLFANHTIHLDVALIQCGPPDDHGFVNLGLSVDVVRTAARSADLVIAQVNPSLPRVHGDGFLHVTEIDMFVRAASQLPEIEPVAGDEAHAEIGRHVAALVPDGATIHVGLGIVPTQAVRALADRRDLGVHTEFFGDWLLDLVEAGAITNQHKSIHRGRTVAAYCLGTKRLYDYVANNPACILMESAHVNASEVIAQNDLMVSVASAQQVDLTGQAAGPLSGVRPFSGPEGQADFLRGAGQARGGRAIVALSSLDADGNSRIVPRFDESMVVLATRTDVHYVVTEYGIAMLRGKSVRERALALIDIAHPSFRRELLESAKNKRYVYADQLPPPDGPCEYRELTTHVRLADGLELTIRPVRPTDERGIQELFHGLTETDRYYRFFSTITSLPHQAAQKLCRTNYRDEMGVVATIPRGDDEAVVGAGQYLLNRRHNLAEFAVMVHKHHRNLGIGTAIIRHLIRLARGQGIAGLRAQVLPHNRPMLHIVKKYGFPVETELRDGALELTLLFRDLPSHVARPVGSQQMPTDPVARTESHESEQTPSSRKTEEKEETEKTEN